MRLLKIILFLIVAALLALTGYAYLGDMAPRRSETRQPVTLNIGAAPETGAATTASQTTDSDGQD